VFREYLPTPALESYVDRFWTKIGRASDSLAAEQRILPDGCVDILFDLTRSPIGFVVGTMTRAIVVASTQPQHVIAVRFRPGAAFAFLRTPVFELTDRHIDLDDVLPNMRALGERLAAITRERPEAAVLELERELLRRLPRIAPLDPLVLAGIERLLRQRNPLRIAELAQALGVTRQHLARQFKVHVGIAPKEFERVARMMRLRRHLAGDLAGDVPPNTSAAMKHPSAAQLACELGYYDQSHMIHEFKSLSGLTPREYAARQRGAGADREGAGSRL